MKFKQKEFTAELGRRIAEIENTLEDYVSVFLDRYKPLLLEKGFTLEAKLSKAEDPFTPGCQSEISVGVMDEEGELIDLHTIRIWECTRHFAGLQISFHLPGSKVTGELLDETPDEVKEELTEYVKDWMEEEE
ncbi:hypothetical protein ACFQPF_17670 [Fictibacillus iocasae]|uniref:Fe-S metabolism associated domain-containing protein n=1 Tax=Fictibacillus iocasae TaxID=2715437 RepID=A0ABW2NW80_9BACL